MLTIIREEIRKARREFIIVYWKSFFTLGCPIMHAWSLAQNGGPTDGSWDSNAYYVQLKRQTQMDSFDNVFRFFLKR